MTNKFDFEKWVVVKVLCSDKKERIGMQQEDGGEFSENRVLMKGITFQKLAEYWVLTIATELELEIFNNDSDHYTPIEY